MNTPRNVQGFTLIELMIVVAIIAILAAIALPAYQDYTIRAQASEGPVLADGAKTAVAEYYSNTGVFPVSNTEAGLDAPTSIVGNYVSQVEVGAGGVITVSYGGTEANAKLDAAHHVTLTPADQGGSVQWTCASDFPAADKKYLPTACR